MDDTMREELVGLVRGRGLAALGTMHEGYPLVSMVLYASRPDLSALYIHVSRLALHTAGILADPRVGLLITELDRPNLNPLAMSRVSIQGRADVIDPESSEFQEAKDTYIAAHPKTAFNFGLGDFLLVRIRPHSARFVGGFGKIVDFGTDDWSRLAGR